MGHEEGVLPGRSLGVVPAPGAGVEILGHLPVPVSGTEEARGGIEQVLVVHGAAVVLGHQLILAQSLGHPRDTPVSVGEVGGEVHRLSVVSRDVAVAVVGLHALAAVAAVGGVVVGVVEHTRKGGLPHLPATDAVSHRLSDDTVDEGAGHTTHLTHVEATGEPAAVLVVVHESRQHLGVLLPCDQREQGVDGAGGVPKAVVHVAHAGANLSVGGAVVDGIPLSVQLVGLAGEEEQAVQAGVEGAHLGLGFGLHRNAGELVLPGGAGLLTDILEGLVPALPIQGRQGHGGADVGKSHAGVQVLARQSDMNAGGASLPYRVGTGGVHLSLPELHHKVGLEVLGQALENAVGLAVEGGRLGVEAVGVVTHSGQEGEVRGAIITKSQADGGAALGGSQLKAAIGAQEGQRQVVGGLHRVLQTATRPGHTRRVAHAVVLGDHQHRPKVP